MKKGQLLIIVLMSQLCYAMERQGSFALTAGQPSLNTVDEETPLTRVTTTRASLVPQKKQEGWCMQETDCCCAKPMPRSFHFCFWGSIIALSGFAVLCVWYHGHHSPKCSNDDGC